MFNVAQFQFDDSNKDICLVFEVGSEESGQVDIFLDESNEAYKKIRVSISEDANAEQLLALGEKLASDITDGFEVISNVNIEYKYVIEGLLLGLTPTDVFASKYEAPKAYQVKSDYEFEVAYTEAIINAKSYNLARMLNNLPHCECNPDTIVSIIKNNFPQPDVNISVLRENECRDLGLNGMLALAQGSNYEPSLIKIEYNNSDSEKIGLVGKGLTFDMGGYSLKVARDVSGMKADMGGASAVIGTMHRLVNTHAKVNVCAYLVMTDNLINEKAMLPGDVIKYRNDLTVEIGNTDAEGRLVLADGLLLAESEGCSQIIDVATLTGNVGAALGTEYAAVYSRSEQMQNKIFAQNSKSNEKVWPMPLVENYRASLKGNITDLRNISSLSYAGSITAAIFLSHFVTVEKWAHIDMAAMTDKAESNSKYSGYGVRLLTNYITSEQN